MQQINEESQVEQKKYIIVVCYSYSEENTFIV